MKAKQFVLFYILVIGGFLIFTHMGSQAVAVLSESAPLEERTCIIIDAGHGGIDGGATSCTGVLESQFNLDIALRLEDMLHLLGFQTKMTRRTDTSIYTQGNTIAAQKVSDLKERVRLVDEEEQGILISIHQNNFSDSRYGGGQVFYNGPGETLAKLLQQALKDTLNPDSHRQAKKAQGIYLMEHIQRPGVLLECGFLSNPEEEARLRSPEYQKKLCCVIGATLSRFLTNT